MANDYNEFIQRVLQPEIIDTIYLPGIGALEKYAAKPSPQDGDRITERFKAATSSNAAAYGKGDSNPASATNTLIKPYWSKVQYHGSAEVSNIDLSNAKSGSARLDMVRDAVTDEVKSIMNVVLSAMLTQVKADIDSTSVAYSDGSLSRSTYATLASYEEATDATVTLAYVRGMVNGTIASKHCGPLSGYITFMERSVYNTFKPLAAALHTWSINDAKAGQTQDTGYQDTGNFEGLPIALDGEIMDNMTTGDVFMIRKQDLRITTHRSLEIEQVESGRDTVKFVPRIGIQAHVVNPGFQGKMTSKD